MSVTATLTAVIYERCEGRPPSAYADLGHGWRLGCRPMRVCLYRTDRPGEQSEPIAESGRDASGARWFLVPGWRERVKEFVQSIGMEVQEEIEEITW